MKKLLKFAGLPIVAAIILITLTAGGGKEYRGGRDMVEVLYDQAVKDNDALESIEEDIQKFEKKKYDAVAEYNSYSNYNNTYYADAREQVNRISDPATKQRANDQLNQSEAAYKAKITSWQTLIGEMNTKENELRDLHVLLKIITTRPMIEKYQGDKFPDQGKLKEVNEELKRVIERIKSITK